MTAGSRNRRLEADLKRLEAHQRTWALKPALRRVYRDFHERLLAASQSGRLLEVGAGPGHFSRGAPNIIALDILCSASIDVNADAHGLPFREAAFDGIVMLDTLHHLQRPVKFLREAARVVRPGGSIAMIEPGITPLSGLLYRLFHEEPVDMAIDPYADGPLDPKWQAFDANQATPTRMFFGPDAAGRLTHIEPRLRLRERKWLSLWAYPLSGGFRSWQLIPGALAGPLLRLEESLLPLIGFLAALRLFVVLERVQASPAA